MPIIDWSAGKKIHIDPGADISDIIAALQKDLDSKVTAAILNAAVTAEKNERIAGDKAIEEASKLVLTEEDPESGTHNGYILTQGNRLVGHIHTPSIIRNAYLEKDGDKTYLVLEFAGAVEPVKIDVTDLIDLYTGSTGEMIDITIDDNNKISATIKDGSITRAKVAADIEESLKKADEAKDYTDEQVAAEKDRAEAAEAELKTLIEAEEDRAIAAEADLQSAIDAEAEERASKDEELQTAITSEVERATNKEEEIATNLANEITRATGRENELQTAIEAEESRATGKEAELEAAIAQEIADRENGDAEEVEARTAEIARVDAAIAAEIARATAKESAIEASLAEETTNRINGDKELSDAIEAVEAAYKAADTELETNLKNWVDGKKYATVAYVDGIDATKADISYVNDKIATEVTAREQGDQDALLTAKGYTDDKLAEEKTARETNEQQIIDLVDLKADKETTYTKSEVDALLETAGTVKDVKVNGESVLEEGVALIKVKTINGSAITGEGDLEVGGVTPEEKALIDTIPDKATKEEVEAVEAKIPSLEGYATEEWVEGKGYLTEHQSLTAYRTSAEQDTIDEGKADKTEVSSISSVLSETKVLLNREVEAREGLSEFVGDTPLETTAQTVTAAINELKAGGSVEEWTLDEIKAIFG